MPKLFSYGTLQLTIVQEKTFGRILDGQKEELVGYRIDKLKITDPVVIKSSGKHIHPILFYTGNKNDVVKGVIFELTNAELLLADLYEVNDYKRTKVVFKSGVSGFAYIKRV
ncbi:MAG: gamma-glutamylcyclotransferase [Flavobacteriaceae bacterium]|nr:gamma-glutamylcyclotransferase [Flavobacteriaceae bacterium]